MSKKKIETRIQQKHDFEVNWRKATGFEPYEGELIIYEAEVDAQGNELAGIRDENGNLPEGRTEPIAYPRFKVGDGKTNVNDLPFTSEADLLIKKGEGNSSIVMGDLTNNQAMGTNSHVSGYASIAGGKCYYFSDIDFENKTIYLSNTQVFGPKTEVSGVWKFKYDHINDSDPKYSGSHLDTETDETKEWSTYIPQDITYSCNGVSYDKMSVAYSTQSGICGLYYYQGENYTTVYGDIPSQTGGWQNEAYKTIDFGKEAQAVSAEFYSWLIDVARPDSSDITIPEEIATAIVGKYLYIVNKNAYYGMVKVDSVETGCINYIGNLGFNEIYEKAAESTHIDDWTVRVPSVPEFGIVAFEDERYGGVQTAEGYWSYATGIGSHAEGSSTAAGSWSHAEGSDTEATYGAHSEGSSTKALGVGSHAEGSGSIAGPDPADVESGLAGQNMAKETAYYTGAHAEGYHTRSKAKGAHAEGIQAKAIGHGSHAEGQLSEAHGLAAHSEGIFTKATGESSHAEGKNTESTSTATHAEGGWTKATQPYAHSEGQETQANGKSSHVEGALSQTGGTATSNTLTPKGDTTSGAFAHAEGNATIAKGVASHSEGTKTFASGKSAHAEGGTTTASGEAAHAEGTTTVASGVAAHAEGNGTQASGAYSHTEGTGTTATLNNAHAEGNNTHATGYNAHAEGQHTTASENSAHAEGEYTTASARGAHAEGKSTTASANYAHAEGNGTTASAEGAHAEGQNTIAKAKYSHAEGCRAEASDSYAHAEGTDTKATKANAHAEGNRTQALNFNAHAEGQDTIAEENSAHAEGDMTKALKRAAHSEGRETIAYSGASHAEGYKTKAGTEGKADYEGAHAEGYQTTAIGQGAHAEGRGTAASADGAHAGGAIDTAPEVGAGAIKATGKGAFAHGYTPASNSSGDLSFATSPGQIIASGEGAFAVGLAVSNDNSGNYDGARKDKLEASGKASFASGMNTVASGDYSMAGGFESEARGYCSFASGKKAIAFDGGFAFGTSDIYSDSVEYYRWSRFDSTEIIDLDFSSFTEEEYILCTIEGGDIDANNYFFDTVIVNPTTRTIHLSIKDGVSILWYSNGHFEYTSPEWLNFYNVKHDLKLLLDPVLTKFEIEGAIANSQATMIGSGETSYKGVGLGNHLILGNYTIGIGNDILSPNTAESVLIGQGLETSVNKQVILGSYNAPSATAKFILGNGESYTKSNLFTVGTDDKGNYITLGNDKIYEGGFGGGSTEPTETAEYNILTDSNKKTFIANDLDDNNAVGQYSTALGKNTLAHGDYSHAGGYNTKAYGSESVVFGRNNSAGARGYYLNNAYWDDSYLYLALGTVYKNYCTITDLPGIEPADWDLFSEINIHITDHYPNFDFYTADKVSGYLWINRGSEQVEEFISILQELNGGPAQNASNTRTWSVVNTSMLDSGEVYFGNNSFVSGESNKGWGNHIHIEGARNFAAGEAAHAEGADNSAEGNNSHVEGQGNVSYGNDSHAEGRMTRSEGEASHAGGVGTIAKEEGQTVVGKYNSDDEKALFVVGAGTSDSARSNAFAAGKDSGGAYITVGNTKYHENDLGGGGPKVTAADNGKIMMVVDGKWAAVSLPVYNGETV